MVSRPIESILDELNNTTKILGMNISGIKTVIVYGDMNGLIYERAQIETPADLPFLECFDLICSQADKLLKVCRAQGLHSPEVISLAISGPLDRLKGAVLTPPDLPMWENAPVKGRLGVRYNLPVFIEHRSSAAALAEMYLGAGVHAENLVFIDLEPVVSAGLIVGRKIYYGANDASGEIGRMRMAGSGPAGLDVPGSLTGFASGQGLAELASMRYPQKWPSPPNPYELVREVQSGDLDALAVVAEAAEHLGKAVLWLILTLDTELVLLGHPGDVLGEGLLSPLREAVLRHGGTDVRQLPRLMGTSLGPRLDDTAALMAVIDAFKSHRRD